MTKTLTIDASALAGANLTTWFSQYFSAFSSAAMSFYGGTPDAAYGSTYYMNGSQVLASYNELVDGASTATTSGVLIEGADLAYDMIHHGSAYGHGISGAVDSLSFGEWVDGTTGTQGTGAAGEITNYGAALTIDGFDTSAAAGAGANLDTNATYALYKAIQNRDAAALEAILSNHAVEVYGSAGADTLAGYGHDDTLIGGNGNDNLQGNAGRDQLLGGLGNDTVTGGAAADRVMGGAGADNLNGGGGKDVLQGGAGADRLLGGGGSDILTGGSGADIFVFQAVAGTDVVTDFDLGVDRLHVAALNVDSLAELTLTDTDDGVLVGNGTHAILLADLTAAALSDANFIF